LLCEEAVRDAAAQGSQGCARALRAQLLRRQQPAASAFSALLGFLVPQLAAVVVQTATRGALARSRATALFAALRQQRQAARVAEAAAARDPGAVALAGQLALRVDLLEGKLRASSSGAASASGLALHLRQQVASLRARADRGGPAGALPACAAAAASIEAQIRQVTATALPPSLPSRTPAPLPNGRVSLKGTPIAAIAASALNP
jgi:hypothetical protein